MMQRTFQPGMSFFQVNEVMSKPPPPVGPQEHIAARAAASPPPATAMTAGPVRDSAEAQDRLEVTPKTAASTLSMESEELRQTFKSSKKGHKKELKISPPKPKPTGDVHTKSTRKGSADRRKTPILQKGHTKPRKVCKYEGW